jgi:hypothetical protein
MYIHNHTARQIVPSAFGGVTTPEDRQTTVRLLAGLLAGSIAASAWMIGIAAWAAAGWPT